MKCLPTTDKREGWRILHNGMRKVFCEEKIAQGLKFTERTDLPKYHSDVKSYQVYDADGTFLSVLYTDFFPRSNKEGGAWMTEFRGQEIKDGVDVLIVNAIELFH